MKDTLAKILASGTPLDTLRTTMITSFDDIMDEMLSKTFPELSREVGAHACNKGAFPKVNIIDYADKIVIEAEVCGLSKEDVEVKCVENTLTIRGNKQEDKKTTLPENGTYLKREIKRSSFERSFQINPEKMNKDGINAKFVNGSLAITIPKKVKVEPKVEVQNIKID